MSFASQPARRHSPLGLPISPDYLTWDFRRDMGADLDKAEK